MNFLVFLSPVSRIQVHMELAGIQSTCSLKLKRRLSGRLHRYIWVEKLWAYSFFCKERFLLFGKQGFSMLHIHILLSPLIFHIKVWHGQNHLLIVAPFLLIYEFLYNASTHLALYCCSHRNGSLWMLPFMHNPLTGQPSSWKIIFYSAWTHEAFQEIHSSFRI